LHYKDKHLILFQGLEVLPSMYDRSSIDFGDALEYPGFEFVEGLYSDVPEKASRHFAKQRLDDV
jgi:hypothetical protein